MSPREYLVSLELNEVPHSGKTFLEHLYNVEDILRICGQTEDICLAGLYHSIYGTNYFKVDLAQDRTTIQKIIGERAEHLVWLFCNANRPFCWFCGSNLVMIDGTSVTLDANTLHNLQMIEGANLLEQKCGADMIVLFTANRINK